MISLFGERFTSTKVRNGKFPNWRAFDMTHLDDFPAVKGLIREAHSHRVAADEAKLQREAEKKERLIRDFFG